MFHEEERVGRIVTKKIENGTVLLIIVINIK